MTDASSWCDDYFFLAAFFAGFFAAAFFVAMNTPPPFDFKMVIAYVWYSRVCAASKIFLTQIVPVGGNGE
ncbi:MAG: hypothetical protein HP494_12985 [Nitrospira sp.]|nr:hypothetical protein [Nitrospira sp.]MBH0188144.1 hypothetical protein [Nitrospira sp.]MBH0196472.1 hypothetical protein [Nitrospira sp.]